MTISTNFLGNLGRDASLRETNNGPVCSFSVAVNTYGEDQPEWISCSMFGNRAEKLAPYLTVGTKVAINGRAKLERYTKKDGKLGASLNVSVVDLVFASNKAEEKSASPSQAVPQIPPYSDSDCPF